MGASVVGLCDVGVSVVGLSVVGTTVVGLPVVGTNVVGLPVVGASVVGLPVVGASVVGLPVGRVVGVPVEGEPVDGTAVDGAALVGAAVHAPALHTSDSEVMGHACATPTAAAAISRVLERDPAPHALEQLLQLLQSLKRQSEHCKEEHMALLASEGHSTPPNAAASVV